MYELIVWCGIALTVGCMLGYWLRPECTTATREEVVRGLALDGWITPENARRIIARCLPIPPRPPARHVPPYPMPTTAHGRKRAAKPKAKRRTKA